MPAAANSRAMPWPMTPAPTIRSDRQEGSCPSGSFGFIQTASRLTSHEPGSTLFTGDTQENPENRSAVQTVGEGKLWRGAGQPRFFLKRINVQRKRASGVAASRAIKVKKDRLSQMRPGTGAEGCREFGEVDERGI